MPQSVRRPWPFVLAVLCLFTVLPGLFLSLEDSEIWGITSSRRMIEQFSVLTSAHYKPLFSLMFGAIVHFAKSDWSALIASRFLALAFTAGGLYSLYSLSFSFLSSKRPRSITVAFYAVFCTMPLFLVHFPKARSDSVSASIILIAAFVLMSMQNRSRLARGTVYLASSLCALLVTPKSIDLVAALALIFWVVETRERNRKFDIEHRKFNTSLIVRTLAWTIGPILLISIIAMIGSREYVVRALVYWFDSYTANNPLSWRSWNSVVFAVESAPIVSFVIAAGLLVGVFRFKQISPRERVLVVIGLLAAFFVTIHSQKYFFFLATRAPFIALGALPGIHLICAWIAKPDFNATVLRGILLGFAFLFLLSLGYTFERLRHYPGFALAHQRQIHHELSDYLNRAGSPRYWDAIGLFPKRNSVFHYPSPGDKTNDEMLAFVDSSQPTLILRTAKMEILEPYLFTWLQRQFAKLNPEVYAKIAGLSMQGVSSECEIPLQTAVLAARAERLSFPIILLTRTNNVDSWVQVPLTFNDGRELNEIVDGSERLGTLILNDCKRRDVRYGFAEKGPWQALPAPEFSLFFGYDGRL